MRYEHKVFDVLILLINNSLLDVVLVKSCRQSKHTAAHVLPTHRCQRQVCPGKNATASFAWAKEAGGNLQSTIYVYEKD